MSEPFSLFFRLTACELDSRKRDYSRIIGTTFSKAARNRRTRNAALCSGREFPRQIVSRKPQHDRFNLFRTLASFG
jgi:hypothetical protein